jgi:tetratricopeptide (TPR) repeat protein
MAAAQDEQKKPSPLDNPLLRDAYQTSQKADEMAEFDRIIELCQQALDEQPDDKQVAYAKQLKSWAHNRRGESLAVEGDEPGALAEFEISIELDPTRWKAVHNRAVSLAVQGRYDEALDEFSHTIELNPKYGNAYFNRGELLVKLGRVPDGITDLDQAIRLAPNDAAAYHSRGMAHAMQRAFRRAYEDFTRAIKLNPKNADAYISRADMYGDVGDYGQAARDYRAAIRIDPKSARAYLSAAWLMATCAEEKFRDADLAVQSANRAKELGGGIEEYRLLDVLAAAYANAGQWDEAVETQTQTVEASPEGFRPQAEARLKLYEQQKPYRASVATESRDT